jgi:hypothetical protein
VAHESDVQAALAVQLASLGEPVQWENTPFTPGAVRWMRETFKPSPTAAASLGTDGFNRLTGVYLVDIFAPPATGREDGNDLFALLAAAFPRGGALTYETTTVRIVRTYRSGGTVKGDWYQVPVAIEYQADVPPV